MNNLTHHTHEFVNDILRTLQRLNRYIDNKKFNVFLTSERTGDKTIVKFELTEGGRFVEDNIFETRVIYGRYYYISNISIDNATVDILALEIDKFINYAVKEDFIMSAVTNFSSMADKHPKHIDWNMGYDFKNKP